MTVPVEMQKGDEMIWLAWHPASKGAGFSWWHERLTRKSDVYSLMGREVVRDGGYPGATTEGIETKGRENQTVNSKTPQRSATGFMACHAAYFQPGAVGTRRRGDIAPRSARRNPDRHQRALRVNSARHVGRRGHDRQVAGADAGVAQAGAHIQLAVVVVCGVEIAIQRGQQIAVAVVLPQMPEHHAAQLLLLDVLRFVFEAFGIVIGDEQPVLRMIQVRVLVLSFHNR